MDARSILDLFRTGEAFKWHYDHGREEIPYMHIPLGWVALELTPELNRLIEAGIVHIVDLPATNNPARRAQFLVRTGDTLTMRRPK